MTARPLWKITLLGKGTGCCSGDAENIKSIVLPPNKNGRARRDRVFIDCAVSSKLTEYKDLL